MFELCTFVFLSPMYINCIDEIHKFYWLQNPIQHKTKKQNKLDLSIDKYFRIFKEVIKDTMGLISLELIRICNVSFLNQYFPNVQLQEVEIILTSE